MKRCDKLVDIGRRQFLRGSAMAAAGVVASSHSLAVQTERVENSGAVLQYPSNRLANITDLKPNQPYYVFYPDPSAPGVLLKLGTTVENGVGELGDIVGFSTLCPHQGYPLIYQEEDRAFNCPGHYSRYDAEAGGQQIWGQASQNLPQYLLRIESNGDIYADGLDELIFGRLSNVL